ncbi:MAG: antitermination protein NusG [Actinobacteria bacterium]|nr:antitermination protein NusG [Actinomycetota bacterium]
MIALELLTRDYLGNFAFRWLHVVAGVCWIGLLYYFNLVQVPGLAGYGDEGKARNITIDQIARRALWWFRWAAIATLVTGILITGLVENYFENFMGEGSSAGIGHNVAISVGMVLGILMAANVWMIIWKNQKVVLANAANVLAGKEADPSAAAAGRKALLASRQNFIFSFSMLFYMVGAAHFYSGAFGDATSSNAWTFFIVSVVIIAVLQINALGLLGGTAATNKLLWPYESHKNALIAGGVLWLVLWLLSEFLLA